MENRQQPNVLLVEDEDNLHEVLKLNLELEGYEVSSSYNGADALDKLEQEHFDLVVLDWMLPEVDGLQVLETMRVKNLDTPVLMLSARNAGTDRITGLRKGADDYLTKPFELEELMLRMAKLLKGSSGKTGAAELDEYSFGGNTIYFGRQEAKGLRGELISLSKKETMLLRLLIEQEGQVVSREKILNTVWGYNVYPTTRTIDNFILNFRKYFEQESRDPRHFHSARGVGYRFTAQPSL